MKTKIEFTLEFVSGDGNRSLYGDFPGFDGLTKATEKANYNGLGEQVTFEEAQGYFHAHIMEFRDDEHYNDIYLVQRRTEKTANVASPLKGGSPTTLSVS